MNITKRIVVRDEIDDLINRLTKYIETLELENDKLRRELDELKLNQLQVMLGNLRDRIAA